MTSKRMLFTTAMILGVATCSPAESLNDKLAADPVEGLKNSVTLTPQELTPEQQRIQKLTDTPDTPINGITVKVIDVNISKKSSISVDYNPEVKHGEMIDNKEKTSVKYNYKF